jgi:hypothetical protein
MGSQSVSEITPRRGCATFRDIPKFFEVNFSSDTLTYEFSDGSDQQHVTVYLKTAPPLLLQGGPSPWGKVKHSVKYEIGKLQE